MAKPTKTSPDQKAYEQEREFAKSIFLAAHENNVKKLGHLAEDLGDKHNIAEYKDGEGHSPLFYALENSSVDALQYLIDHQKDASTRAGLLNQQDAQGYTMLMQAAKRGNVPCAKVLVDSGADVSIKREDGSRAIHFAAMSGSKEIIQMVADASKDGLEEVNAWAEFGNPVHWAAGLGQAGAVSLLLSLGADPNVINDDHVTALIMAATQGDVQTITALLASDKCDPTLSPGTNALFVSAAHGQTDAAKMLVSKFPQTFWEASEGMLPIQAAAYHKHRQVVEALIAAMDGQDKNVEGYDAAEIFNADILMKKMGEKLDQDVDKLVGEKAAFEDEAKAAKDVGNKQFITKQTDEAIEAYSKGIEAAKQAIKKKLDLEHLHVSVKYTAQMDFVENVYAPLLANRCSAYLQKNRTDEALDDAKHAVKMAPKWGKAKFRLGQCHTAKHEYADAAQAYWDAYQLGPKEAGAATLMKLFKQSVELGKKKHQQEKEDKEAKDFDVPIEVPVGNGAEFKTLRLKFKSNESPVDVAARFLTENKLDLSLVDRIAHHVNLVKEQES